MAPRGQDKGASKSQYAPDPDEQAAIEAACAETGLSAATVTRVISAWIQKRAQLTAGRRLVENLVFDLNNAHLRGIIAALLPALGQELSDLPPNVAFFDLDREQVIDVFMVGYAHIQASRLAASESSDFPFDDPIPF